jgi:hypothetical protein
MKGEIQSCYPFGADVYSPLPLESHTQGIQEWGAMDAFAWIYTPPDLHCNPYWATPLGSSFIELRRYTLTRFIQRRFNKGFSSDYDIWSPRRGPKKADEKQIKAQIDAEATLWIAVRRVLLELQARNKLSVECAGSPMIALFHLVTETGGLLFPWVTRIAEGEKNGVVAISRGIQSQNKKLQLTEPENPFCNSLNPFSYWFVKEAIALAEASDEGRKDWMNVVAARMKLSTVLKSSGLVVFTPKNALEKRAKRK